MARQSARKTGPDAITRGSGNVFADLNFPDAGERQTKLRLVHALNILIDAERLTQCTAALRLGLTQPKVSALRNYKLGGSSVERLMSLFNALDRDVEIIIRKKSKSRGARICMVAV